LFDRDAGECPDRWCTGRDRDKPGQRRGRRDSDR